MNHAAALPMFCAPNAIAAPCGPATTTMMTTTITRLREGIS
jgi:hypothetical protein